jgi:LysM repeat protein/predicted nucleic acid-binding Zn ribbon protein
MESSPGRRCPHCGTPVAQRADTCLMCGALLKERKKRSIRLPQGDLWLPLFIVMAIALVWLWKPWEAREPQAMVSPTASVTPTATPLPTATFPVAPTATPLYSPTPPPTATLPPNQTRHVVESGETVGTIAKKYGTTTAAILEANGLKERTLIHPGDELIIPLPLADTPTPTPTLTPSPTPFIYKIKSGDTLSAIAKRFGTTVEVLMEVNSITDATNLRIGTELTIMQPPDFTATMAYEIYEVEQGDTLISISAKYNVTVAQIREANGLEGNNLRVGQELRIPVGTATPTPTLTATPTLTPTPGPARAAPALLAPPDGTAFAGADTAILLNWASVGILGEDEWYVVRLQRVDESAEQPPLVWTKATSWRLPADLYIAGLDEPQQFRWEVQVMRQTGEADDGTRLGEEISPPGDVRTFSWK